VHDFLSMVQALSSHPVATHLQADAAVQEKIGSDVLLADLYCTDEDADDYLITILPEQFPDPAPPENFGNPEEVSIYAPKQSKLTNHPANSCHVFFNLIKPSASFALIPSDELVVKRENSCQVHLPAYSISTLNNSSIQSLIGCGVNGGIVASNAIVVNVHGAFCHLYLPHLQPHWQ